MQNARGCVIAWAEAIWSRCHYLRSRFRLPTEERLVTSLTRLRDRRMEISDKSGKKGQKKMRTLATRLIFLKRPPSNG